MLWPERKCFFSYLFHNQEYAATLAPPANEIKQCESNYLFDTFQVRWCKREYVEPNALKEWKASIFKIVDQRIKFYSQNTNPLPPKPKSTFRHLMQSIHDFHRKYVWVPAVKAANNVVVV